MSDQHFIPAAEAPRAPAEPQPMPETATMRDAVAPAAASLAQQLAAAAKQLQQIEQQYLCVQADIDNIRCVALRQQAQMRQIAIDGFAATLLPVKDRLEAVLCADASTCEDLKHGVGLTLQQVSAAFSQHQLLPLRPEPGARFDPAQHQAVALVAAGQAANTVVNTLRCGYLIAGRLLRPALVTVAQASATAEATAPETIAPPVVGSTA